MVSHRKGLSNIPDYVVEELSESTLKQLKKDGMGITFPYHKALQLRVIRNKKDLGNIFKYHDFGGIKKTVAIAMHVSDELRKKHPVDISNGYDNVHYNEKFDKRKNKIEYLYRVTFRYRVNGKLKIHTKTFSFGHKKPSTDKLLHGYRTAKLYKFHLDNFGLKFNKIAFSRWKHERLYISEYQYFDWENI